MNSSSRKNHGMFVTLSSLFLLGLPIFCFANDKVAFDELDTASAAKALGWIANSNQNICGGSYTEPQIVKETPNPKPIDEVPVTITATKPALFSQYGESIVKGNVTLTQPGREITADELRFYRDPNTGKITNSTLVGHVNLRESGKAIVSNNAYWDLENQIITLYNAIYRIQTPAPGGNLDVWGHSKTIVRDKEEVIHLKKATYTSCPASNHSWKIWGNTVNLDKNTGRGTAVNTLLFIEDVPVFYWPYLDFPIDKRRKSGFLYPTFGMGTDGADIELPYYFNLAPNYDATITPRYIGERGMLASGLFRYLTPENSGYVNLSLIPHDSKFANFRDDAQNQYVENHDLSLLENSKDYRGMLAIQNRAKYDPHWSSFLDINYVTDNYFLQDFSPSLISKEDNQLPTQFDLNYANSNWTFLGRVQQFQTLNTVTRTPDAPYQYRRLPQLDLGGNFPQNPYGLAYQVNTDFVNFDFDHIHDPNTGNLVPTGTRLNLAPSASLPLNWAGGYFTPTLELDNTIYSLKNNVDSTQNPESDNITRSLPIFTADSGLYFNRNINLFSENNNYTQTLEPRIYYLLVPNHDQSDIPIFDSSITAFTFDQLFQPNRFSGYDVVGDANQISYALTSRFLDAFTAEEKAHASIGQTYAFTKHKVCIDNDCTADPLAQNYFSPVVANMEYYLNQKWDLIADAAWDPNKNEMNNDELTLKYHDKEKHIVSIGYNFIRNGDPVPGFQSSNLDRINLGVSWPLTEQWNLLGDWNYNLSHTHPETYFYGIEYENCCWAFRLVQSETYVGTDENNVKTYNRGIYVQFLLKGLGSIGSGDASDLITSQIPFYENKFVQK